MLSLFQLNRNIRTIRRYKQIGKILGKYGLEHLLEYFNLSHIIAMSRRVLRRKAAAIAQYTPAERMRLAFEELGPTFIKLGQLLSTRPDVIPKSFVDEFAKLQDNVPSFPYEEATTQISLELGKPVEEIFAHIDPVPVAAASIAQVHRARLKTGEDVVVKVRRPGVEGVVETDINVLMGIAQLMERHMHGSDIYDPVGLVKEFARTIRREMDFSREGHTIEKIRDNFCGDRTLHFPTVFWGYSGKTILTLEYIDGIKVNDYAAIDRTGLDRKLIATRGADAFLKMVLDHGFFHGDPHPGNVLILPDNIICLLDYGIVGRLDQQLKKYLTDIIFTIINRDVDELVSLLIYSGEIGEILNRRALKRELSEFIDSYYEIPLHEIEVGRMLVEFIDIVTTFQIKLQPDLMLLAKSLVIIEGMGRELDPDFDMVEHLKPFMEKALKEKITPGRFFGDVSTILRSYLHMAANLPRDLREIVHRLNHNKFKIDLEHRGLDHFSKDLDKSINRLSFSLIIAALIIGSSIVMQTNKGPLIFDFPAFAFLGYTIAGLIGFWWVIAIIRSGRL